MVSGPCLNNNTMDTYKLLDLSGSDSENDVVHFTPMKGLDPPPRKKRLKRRERDMLRVSPSHVDEEAGRVCSCAGFGVGSGVCQSWRTNAGETVRSVLLVLALAGLSLLTLLALHLQSRLDATQRFVSTGT